MAYCQNCGSYNYDHDTDTCTECTLTPEEIESTIMTKTKKVIGWCPTCKSDVHEGEGRMAGHFRCGISEFNSKEIQRKMDRYSRREKFRAMTRK